MVDNIPLPSITHLFKLAYNILSSHASSIFPLALLARTLWIGDLVHRPVRSWQIDVGTSFGA